MGCGLWFGTPWTFLLPFILLLLLIYIYIFFCKRTQHLVLAGLSSPMLYHITQRFFLHTFQFQVCVDHLIYFKCSTHWSWRLEIWRNMPRRNVVSLAADFFRGGCQTATRFDIPHFDNPFSGYYQPNNYLTNIIVRLSSQTMTSLNHMREMLLFVCSKMAD